MGLWTQRFVGAVMLTVLASLPAAATLCEALCDDAVAVGSTSEATDTSTDQNAAGCHESSSPADVRIAGVSTHDCRAHGDGLLETEAAVTAGRTELGLPSLTGAPAFATAVPNSSSPLAHVGYTPPPGAAPSRPPLVLRV